MKSRTCFLAIAALVAVVGCAQDSFPPEFDQKPVKRILASQDEYYGPARPALERLLVSNKKNDRKNHFCVVGYAYSDKYDNVWVHWIDEQRLILWRNNAEPELREKGLVASRRSLKLGQDTVETDNDVNGSSYLVTRAWWQAVAKDCEAHGERYTIEPFVESPEIPQE